MDDIFKDFALDDSPEALLIPEPKTHGDIRPNPIPMPAVPEDKARVPNALPVSTRSEIPEMASATEEAELQRADDNVIKTADFHALESENVGENVQTHDETPAGKNDDAKCFAFMGASGGAGVTSLCIQLAYDIAKRTRKSSGFMINDDPKVCLIDLDFETGCCAAYLDVPPALDVKDVCGPADRIDTAIVQALMSHHESGIAVLSTPNALGANSLANPETVLKLLDAASQVYDYIILDLPRIWQPWIGAAISGADHFGLVSELTIPSLHTARTRMQNIETVVGGDMQGEFILNKVERRSFRNSVRLSDAEKALQRSVSATICVDVDTTREAINCGEAIEVIRPESRYVKDVKNLSQKWVPDASNGRKLFKDRRRKRSAA